MTEGLEFYNAIDKETVVPLLEQAIREKVEVVLKIHDAHHRTRFAAKKSLDQISLIRFIPVSFQDERVTISFEVDRRKYFFKTSLSSKGDDISIKVPAEVFKLQRRNNFRVVIPDGVKYTAEIKTINGKRASEKFEMRDISLGGCQIVFNKPKLMVNKNDEVQFNLQMLDVENELITCQVKHLLSFAGESKLQAGLEFVNPDSDFLTDLQSLMIHLDRILRGKKYD